MPTYTLTIEDTSPIISYSSNWLAGNSQDPTAFLYSESTFQTTQVAGATASLTFNGTGIQIIGSKRDNHGPYQVRVDNTVNDPVSGQNDAGQFQAVLFEVHGLPQGKHDVTLMNLGAQKFLDIDCINIEGNVGESSGKLFVNTYQDTDSSFSYTPSEQQWSTNPTNLGSFFGSTGHATMNPGAIAHFRFTGDGVSLYGPKSKEGSPYSVQLDGGPVQNYTTIGDRYLPQTLLYHATSLGKGQHQLKISYQPTSPGQVFAIDYANVFTTNGPNASAGDNGSSNLSAGAIVGIILAVSCMIGVFIALFWMLRRRRQIRDQELANEKTSAARVQPFTFSQQDPSRAVSHALTHSSFGPGPATGVVGGGFVSSGFAMDAPLRPISETSFGNSSVSKGLRLNTNRSGLKNQVRFDDGPHSSLPVSPEERSISILEESMSDASSEAHLVNHAAGNSTSPRRLLPRNGPNGYPLEKVPFDQRFEEEEELPAAGSSSLSLYPYVVRSAAGAGPSGGTNPGGYSVTGAVLDEGNEGPSPPNYHEATELNAGRRVR